MYDKISASHFSKTFKKADIFGQTIQFTFNGHEKFKTVLGASLTLLLGFTLVCYCGATLPRVISGEISSITSDEQFRDNDTGSGFNPVLLDGGQEEPSSKSLKFAFGFQGVFDLDPAIATIELEHATVKELTNDHGDIIKQKSSRGIDHFSC